MSISFGLGVGLSQSQKLTPQMQQAIKLLQLSGLELEQEIQAKLDSNPLLERLDEAGWDNTPQADFGQPNFEHWAANTWQASVGTYEEGQDGFEEAHDEDSLDKLINEGIDDEMMDMAWQEIYGDDVIIGDYAHQSEGEIQLATESSIQDHVRWQMNFKHLSVMDKLIAEQLIDAMDEQGFIRTNLEELTKSFNTVLNYYDVSEYIDVLEVKAVLKMIQSCNPVGVGAQDLVECLQLQLNQLPDDCPSLRQARAVLASSEHLKSNNIKALANDTGLSLDEIKQALDLIRTLDANPAHSFAIHHQHNHSSHDVPDILVLAKGQKKHTASYSSEVDQWRVLLNPDILPRLGINQEYASLIKRGDDSPDNQYLKTHLSDAKLFVRSIDERNQNLLRVAACVIAKQQDFLRQGATAVHPLKMREVADALQLHESTVSRLTTNKTILTPQGLYPLRYFFSTDVSGNGDSSAAAISAIIKQMIETENPKKPLSDSDLSKHLQEQGMTVARRTVAKYREAMGIGSSTERKKKL